MRLLPAVLFLASCVTLAAGEAAQPALSCFIPDFRRFVERLAKHPNAAAWATRPAEAGDAAWTAVARRTTQARAEFSVSDPHGGQPACKAVVALLAPEAADPEVSAGLRSQRAGAWWLVGRSWRQLGLPEETRLTSLAAGGDMLLAGRLRPWLRLLAPEQTRAWDAVLAAWGLDRLEIVVDLAGGRFVDRTLLAKAQLPLRTIDPAALAGIPADGLAFAFLGLDGAGLAKQSRQLLGAVGLDPQAVKDLEEQLQLEYGVGLEALVQALDGTVSMSLHGSHTRPDVLIGLPLSPVLKDMLLRRLEAQQPEQGATLLATAAEQAVPFAWPGVGSLFVRLSQSRLWLSSSPLLLEACGADSPTPFPVEGNWPQAADAVALARWRVGVIGTLVVPWGNADGILAGLMRSCVATGTGLPAGWFTVHQDAKGLNCTGEHALAWIASFLGHAQTWAPAVARIHARDCEAAVTATMTTILSRSILFSKATSGHWPRDFAELRGWAKDLTDDSFANAGEPELKQPFCYVAPLVAPPGDQPVLVQDPAANQGRGSWVGFADGRLLFKTEVLYWQEAQRLSALAAARNVGVDIVEWATTPKTF